jgi:hypothetical protein
MGCWRMLAIFMCSERAPVFRVRFRGFAVAVVSGVLLGSAAMKTL